MPFVYLVTFLNIFRATYGFFTLIMQIFAWGIGGPFYILVLILKDTKCLIQIMLLLNGAEDDEGDAAA